MGSSPAERIGRALDRTGVELPRGLLIPDALALSAPPESERARALIAAIAASNWPIVRAPIGAALQRAEVGADDALRADIDAALAWVEDPNPGNPLAMQIALRAGRDLAAALERADRHLASLGEAPVPADILPTAGEIVVDLIDLDVDDLAEEIGAFVQANETDDALAELARATGDVEIREFAREALTALDLPGRGDVLADVRDAVAEGPLPEDPALDPLWVSVIQAMAREAIELASVLAGDDDEAI